MKIFREVFCMILIACAMLLILILVFADYLIDNNTLPDKSKYVTSDNVKDALNAKSDLEKQESSAVIGTLSKAAYNIDENDIKKYISDGTLTQGKSNPFGDSATSTSSNTNGNSNVSANGSSKNGTTDNSGNATNNSTQDNSNNSSTGTLYEKPGTK